MKEITVLDVVLGFVAAGFVVAIGMFVRDHLDVHRPRRNAPAPRRPPPKPIEVCSTSAGPAELGELTVCGEWLFKPGERVRLLIAVPEYGTEIGHGATFEAVWPGDDDMYRFALDGRGGRDAIITFFEHELWQLERIPS